MKVKRVVTGTAEFGKEKGRKELDRKGEAIELYADVDVNGEALE